LISELGARFRNDAAVKFQDGLGVFNDIATQTMGYLGLKPDVSIKATLPKANPE
jgi:hypothetical protein